MPRAARLGAPVAPPPPYQTSLPWPAKDATDPAAVADLINSKTASGTAKIVLKYAPYGGRGLNWDGKAWRAWNHDSGCWQKESAAAIEAVCYAAAQHFGGLPPTRKAIAEIMHHLRNMAFAHSAVG